VIGSVADVGGKGRDDGSACNDPQERKKPSPGRALSGTDIALKRGHIPEKIDGFVNLFNRGGFGRVASSPALAGALADGGRRDYL
jgi:hypothetical protein